MIKINASMDVSGFQKSLTELAGLKKDVPKVVRRVAGNVVKDCVKLTPPFDGAPSSESFNTQRKAGFRAVSNDLNKLFKDVDELEIMKEATKKSIGSRLAKLVKKGDSVGVVRLLNDIKIKAIGFTHTPERDAHLLYRNSYGRTRDLRGSSFFISTGLLAFIKSVQKRVGTAKHGWLKAISILGIKGIPAWIKNQSGATGSCAIKGEGTDKIEVTFENNVPFIQRKGRDLKIVKEAFKSTGVRLAKEVESLIAARMRKAKRA